MTRPHGTHGTGNAAQRRRSSAGSLRNHRNHWSEYVPPATWTLWGNPIHSPTLFRLRGELTTSNSDSNRIYHCVIVVALPNAIPSTRSKLWQRTAHPTKVLREARVNDGQRGSYGACNRYDGQHSCCSSWVSSDTSFLRCCQL